MEFAALLNEVWFICWKNLLLNSICMNIFVEVEWSIIYFKNIKHNYMPGTVLGGTVGSEHS